MNNKGHIKRILWLLFSVFIVMNIIAFFHAYKFTHFSEKGVAKTSSPDKLTVFDKIKTLVLGVNNPRPINQYFPLQKFKVIKLQSNKIIECWNISTDNSKGTVILFHGYSGGKSSMLDKSNEFIRLGYNTMLVDFMGSGGSEGNLTTLGYFEAEEVKTAFDYMKQAGEKNIVLFGTSMGAVAIMKAINDYAIDPAGIILECPFGSMYQTTCARFNNMKVPTVPMASLLVFWGGIQSGFPAFSHRPIEYAKSIKCPVLLLYGELDKNVSRQEIDDIYACFPCEKTLKTYLLAGHENYLKKYKNEWVSDVCAFMFSLENEHSCIGKH